MGIFSNIISFFQSSETKKNIKDIEDILLESGLSPQLSYALIEQLNKTLLGKHPQEKIIQIIKDFLSPLLREYHIAHGSEATNTFEIVLIVGINGVGKTTSIAKLAYTHIHTYSLAPASLLFCAADTFRAGAIEQLAVHAKKLDVTIIKQQQKADPSAVIYDSISHAKANNIKKIFVDTAGRMHTRKDLMQQLEKNYRVCLKLASEEQIKVFVTLDGNSGLNTITQVEYFMSCLPINAIILTKYDGGSRGGVLPSIIHTTQIPCAFLGTGETYKDFEEFNIQRFLDKFVTI